MAKKSGEFSFDDLNKVMSKNSKWGGLMSDGAGVSEITEYIPTGNYILNAAFTGSLFQGIPNNRSVQIYGPSSTGKTYILLNLAREAQKKGYYVIWYDSENAIESGQVKSFGCDITKFRYEPVQTVQEFRTSVTNLVDTLIEQKEMGNTIPKIFIVLDSAGNLATQKEIDDSKAGQEKQDMTRAKVMKSIFRILMSKLGVIGASFVFSNHCYNTLDLFSQQVAAGGTAGEYGASIILLVNKAKLKNGNEQVGIIVNAKPTKNRFCKPVCVKFHIDYKTGLNPFVGLDEYISWDRCGIGRGKFISEKDWSKLSESEQEKTYKVETSEEVKYFYPSDTGRNICCDNGDMYPLGKLFTSQVFTKDRLKRLDEYIQSEFKYPEGVQVNDLFGENVEDESCVTENSESETVEQSSDDMIKNQLFD